MAGAEHEAGDQRPAGSGRPTSASGAPSSRGGRINGEEASANYQAGTAQYHLNAAIAYAIKRYVDVRGDTGFLLNVGAESWWRRRACGSTSGSTATTAGPHLRRHRSRRVHDVVNDNAFTNLMARLNLRCAASVVRRLAAAEPVAWAGLREQLALDPAEVDAWERAADLMHIPYDPVRKVTPQDDTFLEREMWDPEATPPEKFPRCCSTSTRGRSTATRC